MNKDLDDRLMPNGEYRDAKNISINKSQGDGSSEGNVGTAQTVLGNSLLIDFKTSIPSNPVNLEVIGLLPSDAQDKVFAFLTNNTIEPYVPEGAIGLSYLYPDNQGTTSSTLTLINGGSGYSGATATSSGGSGTGMTFNSITVVSGTITAVSINNSGTGYQVGDVVNIVQSGGSNAYVELTSIQGPLRISAAGSGYTAGTKTTTGGSGSGLIVAIEVNGSGGVTSANIISFGGGYQVGDVITISGGTTSATLTVFSLLQSYSAIVSYNPILNSDFKIIVEGSWLNFSTLAPIYAINLIEELLFFTDNRNQPRKVNIDNSNGYYFNEDQISVAKYYPYEAIEVYQPCNIVETTGTSVNPVHEANSAVTTNSTTLNFTGFTNPANPTHLGVVGSLASGIVGGTGYTAGSGILTSGGTGRGLTVTITVAAGAVTVVTIDNLGNGYTNGETITILSGNNNATFVLNFILPQTFVVDGSNFASGNVVVNQAQTIPVGMALDFVEPETTLQDAVDEYLSPTATSVAAGPFSTTQFDLLIANYQGVYDDAGANSSLVGYTVFKETPSGFVSQNTQVTSVTKVSATNIRIVCSPAMSAPFASGNKILLGIPNPYFDSNFKNNANIDYLKDKFVRFSYRYRFDDGEYSLIAPFTQPCFIPEQDGYFTSNVEGSTNFSGALDVNVVSDEEQAYRSTEVAFMENKVNKILLNIPLPSTAGNLFTNFKVSEIDILYKESDQTSIKVVETIPTTNNVQGSSNFYQYEYGSKQPFKVLPQKETTRVYDKVPVRALSQEVSSNRIIYGNYQDKHTPPSFLDYTLAVDIKGGTNQEFSISKNKVDSKTSIVEYPNATLKQNRNYEVGVVLADRFGRQSTVIFSKQSKFASLGEFLASSIYSPYRGPNEASPTNGIEDFDGNALNIQFNDLIRSEKDPSAPGIPGLYNSDQTSADYNPLGWYSFKIVVKQTEQEYYNVYVPAAMAAYPLNRDQELGSTSHIILTNDNINKIPRDLSEVGPTQREFPSSVRLFGRVNTGGTNSAAVNLNEAYFPSRTADLSTSVGTIQDLFNYREFPVLSTTVFQYVFYNYEYVSKPTGTGSPSGDSTSFPDSSSLIARINTQSQFGIQVPTPSLVFTTLPALNVFETAPTVSLLDIYYETTTAGRIDLLNTAIDEGPAPNQFAKIGDFNFIGTEGNASLSDVSNSFKPERLDGSDFPNPAANQMTLVSVVDGLGSSTNAAPLGTPSETGIPYCDPVTPENGIFGITPGATPGSFKLVLKLPGSATALSASTSTTTTLNVSNIVGTIVPGSSVSGTGITPGTKVISYSAPTVTFDQNVNIVAINIPLEFGADAPGLVFRDPIAANNFTFTFECSNPGAGADAEPSLLSVTKSLINVLPTKPIVQQLNPPKTFLCQTEQYPNIATQVGGNYRLDHNYVNLGRPTIATVNFENGSSTSNLDLIDVVPEIEEIYIKVGLNSTPGTILGWMPLAEAADYLNVSSNPDDHVFLTSETSVTEEPGTYYLQGGISFLAENSNSYGLPYIANIVARDAGGTSSICHALFQILSTQNISFDGGPIAILPACPGSQTQSFVINQFNGALSVSNPDSQVEFNTSVALTENGPVQVKATLSIDNISGVNPGEFGATVFCPGSGDYPAFQFGVNGPVGSSETQTVGIIQGPIDASLTITINLLASDTTLMTGQVGAELELSYCIPV